MRPSTNVDRFTLLIDQTHTLCAVTMDEAQELYARFKSAIPPDATYDTLDEEHFGRVFFHYVPQWRHHQDLLSLIFKVQPTFGLVKKLPHSTPVQVFDRNNQGAVDVLDFAVGICRLTKGTMRDKLMCTYTPSSSCLFSPDLCWISVCMKMFDLDNTGELMRPFVEKAIHTFLTYVAVLFVSSMKKLFTKIIPV